MQPSERPCNEIEPLEENKQLKIKALKEIQIENNRELENINFRFLNSVNNLKASKVTVETQISGLQFMKIP